MHNEKVWWALLCIVEESGKQLLFCIGAKVKKMKEGHFVTNENQSIKDVTDMAMCMRF